MSHAVAPELSQVAAARAGDAGAWRLLFERYELPLYAYVFELVRHEQTSLDIVQEAFIRAVDHLGDLRDDAKFGGWLFGIAHRQCLQHWRKSGREEPLADDFGEWPDTGTPGPRELLVRAEQADEFRQCLAQLPSPQRAVLVLHFLEEFPLEEIARITVAPVGTVKSRLHHAKLSLKKLWEKMHENAP